MKKALQFLILCTLMSSLLIAQDDRFSQLNENNISGFAKPLVTSLGSGINSAGFHSASIPSTFGFSISLNAMLINIPDDQLTFTPDLPEGYEGDPAPTFWGKKGGTAYFGPGNPIVMPGGINEQSLPFGMPQITASFMGTEALIRFIPTIKAGEEEISFFGFGIKHSVSRYIPFCPVDIAVQFLYNKLEFSDIIDGTNMAFNAHASKSFGLFTAYSGLQFESSKFDVNYTLEGDPNSGDPSLRQDRKISAEIKGDNKFRFVLGGAVKLAVIVINADVNLSSQTVFTGGLSFEF